jgi:Ca2+-binding RTX toxin-like protein
MRGDADLQETDH